MIISVDFERLGIFTKRKCEPHLDGWFAFCSHCPFLGAPCWLKRLQQMIPGSYSIVWSCTCSPSVQYSQLYAELVVAQYTYHMPQSSTIRPVMSIAHEDVNARTWHFVAFHKTLEPQTSIYKWLAINWMMIPNLYIGNGWKSTNIQ